MWRACRVAALRQLRSEAARLPAARPLALQVLQSASYFTSLAGVDRELLLKRSARELTDELGLAKIGEVAKALRSEIATAIKREDVTSNEILDLFVAAQKTRAVTVMLDAFTFLEDNFPTHINFAVYGEVFRILLRKGETKRMVEVYETAKPRFKAVPEMIYRFGIVGNLEDGNIEEAVKIWDEMLSAGHETTNEITSRFMMAYARNGDKEKVQELYDSVDPQIGYWHESCIDRVILSMGIIEQPAKAFEFYSNSSMKLSGGTLISLLSVCTNNNCKQQASDILANRKKFDLRLDARGYNRIMMTLEYLERNDEIKEVLEEMEENGVRFDTRTQNIIKRNAEYLQGTKFVPDNSKSRAAGFTFSPRIRKLLAHGESTEAAALVDSIVKPVDESMLPEDFEGSVPEGALYVSPSVARDAVRAYIAAQQDDKVAAITKGFSVVRGKYGYALITIIDHYSKLDTKIGDTMSYQASKAMLFQGVQIHRLNDTLTLFRRFHDTDAALELFDQVLDVYANKLSSQDSGVDDASEESEATGMTKHKGNQGYYLNFNIGMLINIVLQTLGENGKLTELLEVVNKLEHSGLSVAQVNYSTILRSMCKQLLRPQNKVYDITSFQTVLKDLRSRGLKPNKTIVGYLCPAYVHANKQQRLELLEAYADTRNNPDDTYVLPLKYYEMLLKFTAEEGDVEELKQLYDEAVSILDDKENRGVPRNWVSILVMKLCKVGNIDEAVKLTKEMPELCGGYTFKAIMSVLRLGLETKNVDIAANMLSLLEERGFTISLADAYDLVHLARRNDLALKALDILHLFEKGNLKDVPEAKDGKGNLLAALIRRRESKAHATQMVKTMYTVVLKNTEQMGLWKQALVLRDRMDVLFGKETLEQITANHTNSNQRRQSEQRRTDDDEVADN